jgi:hypothetical protein
LRITNFIFDAPLLSARFFIVDRRLTNNRTFYFLANTASCTIIIVSIPPAKLDKGKRNKKHSRKYADAQSIEFHIFDFSLRLCERINK